MNLKYQLICDSNHDIVGAKLLLSNVKKNDIKINSNSALVSYNVDDVSIKFLLTGLAFDNVLKLSKRTKNNTYKDRNIKLRTRLNKRKDNFGRKFIVDSYIEFELYINYQVILKYLKRGALPLNVRTKTIKVRGELANLSNLNEELIRQQVELIDQQKRKQRRKQSKQKKVKKQEEYRGELLKKWYEIEEKYRKKVQTESTNISEKTKLKELGIRETSNEYRRCGNCANFNGDKCTAYDVKVSENYYCNRFYRYKELYGGGFSPK